MKFFLDRIDERYLFTYVDVGARGGIPRKWDRVRDSIRVVAFEPDPEEFSRLKGDPRTQYLNYAVHKRLEDLRFHVTASPGCSSILEPNTDILKNYEDSERFRVVREEIIPFSRVTNLDAIMIQNMIQDADFIKLDTQGSELSILEGGSAELVPLLFGAQIEIEFIPMYKHQPLFRDVDAFMDRNGFVLIDLRRQYWKRKDFYDYKGKGQLVLGDALYFRKLDRIREIITRKNESAFAKSKVYKGILACMVYGMFDYAVGVARAGRELGCMSNEEFRDAVFEIRKESTRGIFFRSGIYAKLYNGLKRGLDCAKPRSYLGWSDSDREIGNIRDH
jgi:FkbM family methyltransferase